MTKKLEEILDLPDSKEIIKSDREKEIQQVQQQQNETLRDIAEMDKITSALPAVKGLGEMADKELNEVSDKAMQAYEDLMDLGFNVEDRNAGHVFSAAKDMLKNAIDAKNAKADRKLRAIELQLKKLRLDQNEKKDASYSEVIDAEYVISDRNSLIDQLTKKLTNDK